MKRVELISALLGEIGIPLAGFFWWNWDLHFILLFFLFDQLGRLLFLKKRLNGIQTGNNILGKQVGQFILDAFFVHLVVFALHPAHNLLHSFWKFLTYTEWGIPQGVVLLPLLYFSEKMRLQTDLRMGRTTDWQLTQLHIIQQLGWLRLGFWGILLVIIPLLKLEETLVFFTFLGYTVVGVGFVFQKSNKLKN